MAPAVAVNEAVNGRIRSPVDGSAGLGPRPPDRWSEIEEQVAEIREIYTGGPHRRHRDAIEWQPRAFRSEAEPILTGWPRRVHGLPSLDREPYFAATPTVG